MTIPPGSDNRRPLAALLCAAVCFAAPNLIEGGAWTQPRGDAFVKLTWISYEADEFPNDLQMGLRDIENPDDVLDFAFQSDFESQQAFLYAEYGLRERLTAIVTGVVGDLAVTQRLETLSTSGIGDLELGLKYQVSRSPVVTASYVRVKLPTGYRKNQSPVMGTGEVDAELGLIGSRAYGRAFLSLQGGLRLRGGQYSNQIPLFAELGWSTRSTFAKLYVSDIETLGVLDQLRPEGTPFLEGHSLSLGAGVSARLRGPLWLEVGWKEVREGENIGRGAAWNAGVIYHHERSAN